MPLELLGAVILACLMDAMHTALKDSYTTLCWFKNQNPWKQ